MNIKILLVQIRRNASTNSAKSRMSSSTYCLEIVKKNDYENCLSALLISGPARSAAFAVRAFNVEVASVRDQVSQQSLGLMRLQFWSDLIDKAYEGKPPSQPVALEVWKALQKEKLSKRYFKRIVEAREDNLKDKMMHNLEAVENYAEKSVSSVLYLTLEALSVQNVHADHAASHIGKAQGLANLLRSVPLNASRNIVSLPLDLLAKYKISQNSIVKGDKGQALSDLAFEVASQAHQHLSHARSFAKDIPAAANVALLPAVAVDLQLERLRKVDFDLFHPKLQQRNQWLPAKLWWSKMKNRY